MNFFLFLGNTVRAVFADPDFFADTLGLPRDLIRGFILISKALRSGLPLDPVKFGRLCLEVKRRYYEVVPWAYMSPTVHKVL